MALPQPPFAPDTARPELARRRANFEPLSPASFARRAAFAYPHDLAVAHGRRRYSWAQPSLERKISLARGARAACAKAMCAPRFSPTRPNSSRCSTPRRSSES